VGTRTWAVGEGFGLGDIAVGTALGYIDVRLTELPWRKMHPNLGAFSDRIEMRQSFRDTVPYAQAITDKVV
jgi:glutathione S-transferase